MAEARDIGNRNIDGALPGAVPAGGDDGDAARVAAWSRPAWRAVPRPLDSNADGVETVN